MPEKEAEYNATLNYMWDGAVEAARKHKAQVLITVMGEGKLADKGILQAKAVSSFCKMKSVTGVYTNGTVYEPEFLINASSIINEGEVPLLNLVWFGLIREDNGKVSAFTNGMRCFGRDEMEIVDSEKNPAEIRNMLLDIVAYVIEEDVILHDGETIGFRPGQRFEIMLSEGKNVNCETLKIRI